VWRAVRVGYFPRALRLDRPGRAWRALALARVITWSVTLRRSRQPAATKVEIIGLGAQLVMGSTTHNAHGAQTRVAVGTG
jgi:hypothetical protein